MVTIKKSKKMKITYIILFTLSFLGCSLSSTDYSHNVSIKQERFQGKVKIGMNQDQVKENWGTPDKIIKKDGKDFDEIWIYIPNWKFKNYLYFKNGILVRGDPNPEELI